MTTQQPLRNPFPFSTAKKKQKACVRTAGNTVRGTDDCAYLLTEHEIDKAERIFVGWLSFVGSQPAGGGARLPAGGCRPAFFGGRLARIKKVCFSDGCGQWIKQTFCHMRKLPAQVEGNHAKRCPKGTFGSFPAGEKMGYGSTESRYCPGVIPSIFLKIRIKELLLMYPTRPAIEPMVSVVFFKSSFAWSTRILLI